MKVLAVADNVAPFEILPANGTAGITATPVTAAGGSGGVLNSVGGNISGGSVLPENTTGILLGGGGSGGITLIGNALRVTYKASCALTTGAGGVGVTFDVLVDDVAVAGGMLNTRLFGATFSAVVGTSFMLGGLTPGDHTVRLQFTTDNQSGQGVTVDAGAFLQLEDWTLP